MSSDLFLCANTSRVNLIAYVTGGSPSGCTPERQEESSPATLAAFPRAFCGKSEKNRPSCQLWRLASLLGRYGSFPRSVDLNPSSEASLDRWDLGQTRNEILALDEADEVDTWNIWQEILNFDRDRNRNYCGP